MKRLSPMDSLLLLLEARRQPMHVGALSLFKPPPGSPRSFASQLSEQLKQSTRASAPFNRRLVSRLGLQFWEDDEDFDLAHHYVHLALPQPGRIRELLAMTSRVHSAHLDRAYPLWRTYLIEGLEDGRIASYSKIHHALVDGVAGIRLMIKTMSPDLELSKTMPPPWEIGARKSRTTSLPVPGVPVDAMPVLRSLISKGDSLVRPVFREVRNTVKDFRAKHPDLVTSFQAPRCILNQKITASRRFAAQSYATARVKSIAKAFGATTNDVLLAMCGGALRSYLIELNALPDRPLIAGVPVSVRRDEGESGNEFAFVLAQLGTHISDAAERMVSVKNGMDYAKQRMRGLTPSQVIAFGALTFAPGLVNLATGIDSKSTLINLVISHVPGPRQPVYWQGCRLTGLYPVSMLIDGMALNITLTSRHDFIDFGLIACRKTLPHMQRMLDHLEQSLQDLESAAA